MSKTAIFLLILSVFLCLPISANPPEGCKIQQPTESAPFYVVPETIIEVTLYYTSEPKEPGTTYALVTLRRSEDGSIVQQAYVNIPDGDRNIYDVSINVPDKDPDGFKVDEWLNVEAMVENPEGATSEVVMKRSVFVDWNKPTDPGIPDIITSKPTHNPRPTWTWSPSMDDSGAFSYKVKRGTTAGAGEVIGGSEGVTAASNTWTQTASFPSSGTYYLLYGQ